MGSWYHCSIHLVLTKFFPHHHQLSKAWVVKHDPRYAGIPRLFALDLRRNKLVCCNCYCCFPCIDVFTASGFLILCFYGATIYSLVGAFPEHVCVRMAFYGVQTDRNILVNLQKTMNPFFSSNLHFKINSTLTVGLS